MERRWVNEAGTTWTYRYNLAEKVYEYQSKYATWTHSVMSSWEAVEQLMLQCGYIEDKSYKPGTVHVVSGSMLPKPTNHIKDMLKDAFPGHPNKGAQVPINTQSFIEASQKHMDEAYKILDRLQKTVYGCSHEWATYTGFIKVEVYCIKCKEVRK